MIKRVSSNMLSPDDRVTYRKWLRGVAWFYAACACAVGALAVSTQFIEIQPAANTATSPSSATGPGLDRAASTMPRATVRSSTRE